MKLLLTILFLLFPNVSYAYIDPGNISIIINAILGFLATITVYIFYFFKNLGNSSRKLFDIIIYKKFDILYLLGLFNLSFILPLIYFFNGRYVYLFIDHINLFYLNLFLLIVFIFFLLFNFYFNKNNFYLKFLYVFSISLLFINVIEDYIPLYSIIHYSIYIIFFLICFFFAYINLKKAKILFYGFGILCLILNFEIINNKSIYSNNDQINNKNFNLPNVIIYILDGFSYNSVNSLANSEIYKKVFQNDFVKYENHISNFDETYSSILSIAKANNLGSEKTIFNELKNHYSFYIWKCENLKNSIIFKGLCRNDFKKIKKKKEYIFYLFLDSYFPILLRNKINFNFESYVVENENEFLNDNKPKFLIKFSTAWVDKLDKAFKPGLYEENYIIKLEKDFLENEVLNKLEEFLELLKINEIYDNSFIFITSDHAFRLNDKKKFDDFKFSNLNENNFNLNSLETKIPLFIKSSSKIKSHKKKNIFNSSHADIANTILNNLNIYYDQSFELFDYGQDLLNLNKNRFIEYRQIHYGKNEFCLNSYLNTSYFKRITSANYYCKN